MGIALGFFLLCQVILRWGFVRLWNLQPSQLWDFGFPMGFYYDAVALLLVLFATSLTRLLFGRPFLGFAFTAILLWLAATADLLYARFFNEHMDWLTLSNHTSDLVQLYGMVWELFRTRETFLSLLALLASLSFAFRASRAGKPQPRNWAWGSASVVGFLIAFLIGRQMITAFALHRHFANQDLGRWMPKEWFDGFRTSRATPKNCALSKEDADKARATVAAYRSPGADFQYTFKPAPSIVRQRREQLGLAPTGPINAIALLIESLRGYEFFHPVLGPAVFKRTYAVFRKHGILFPHSYAMAGGTIDGEYGALCSQYPISDSMVGMYLMSPRHPTRCLQGILKDAGYQTFYFNTESSEFNGTRTFEQHHGTQAFYDYDFFFRQGIREKVGQWGLADGPFLQKTLQVLEEAAKTKPFFANVLTLSSHGPYLPRDSDLPETIKKAAPNEQYLALLSTFRYVDSALGDFFDAFFQSSLSDNTVIFLSSDHSIAYPEPAAITEIQETELRSRIVMGILAKNLRKPAISKTFANQIDIAPTLATVLNASSTVGWLGRDLFGPEKPSIWWKASSAGISFRTENEGCYRTRENSTLRCFAASPAADPLYSPHLKAVAPLQTQADALSEFAKANDLLAKNACGLE